jgi:hypothetical protein
VPKIEPVPGQVPAFYEADAIAPEVPYVGPGVEREEVVWRAGTQLDHRWTHRIEGRGRRGRLQHGLYDESQKVYQTGGELSHFVFWKLHLASISDDAWRQVSQRADWIEIVDHERNECWRISMQKAMKYAVRYDGGIGERVGIPTAYWDIITSRGTLRQEGAP